MENIKDFGKVIKNIVIPVFNWKTDKKEIKQKRVIIDIYIFKLKTF